MKLVSKAIQKGVTLVELMVVIAIVATLSAIAIPTYFMYIQTARVGALLSQMNDTKIKAMSCSLKNLDKVFPDKCDVAKPCNDSSCWYGVYSDGDYCQVSSNRCAIIVRSLNGLALGPNNPNIYMVITYYKDIAYTAIGCTTGTTSPSLVDVGTAKTQKGDPIQQCELIAKKPNCTSDMISQKIPGCDCTSEMATNKLNGCTCNDLPAGITC